MTYDLIQLYHGGNAGITFIEPYDGSTGNSFGGVFASQSRQIAESHGDGSIYLIELSDQKILRQNIIDYLDSDVIRCALGVAMPWLSIDDYSLAFEAVVNDNFAACDLAAIPRLFPCVEPDVAAREAKRLRGRFAYLLSYSAVEMRDEYGVSFLVLPGVPISLLTS